MDSTDRIYSAFRHYVGQMLQGCGNAACRNSLCDTGRRNTAPANQCIRKWTPRSARAIALSMVTDSCHRHLCPHYEPQATNAAVAADEEGLRDPSAFLQLLCDTPSIQRLSTGGSQSINLHPYDAIARSLDPLFEKVTLTAKLLPNVQAADLLCSALVEVVQSTTHAAWASEVIGRGNVYPTREQAGRNDFKDALPTFDAFEFPPALRLMGRIIHAVELRACVEDAVSAAGRERARNRCILDMVFGRPVVDQAILLVWLKKSFLLHWDGSSMIKRGTIAAGALRILEYHHGQVEECHTDTCYSIEAIGNVLESKDIVGSWLRYDQSSVVSRHLLSFGFLFAPEQHALYFRTINHLKMRKAHSAAEKAFRVRQRMLPHSVADGLDRQLKAAEEHYLLLSVARTNILRDAYDQLWQRRQNELRLPLRVRLSERDELEIGHDLGGVQIEFFNLLCKEVFAEDAGMFTTDPKTAVSYFRPGSLQPLYMFALAGLLIGLAVYNGITLPISMPEVFYAELLRQRKAYTAVTADGTTGINDGWPEHARSLRVILESQVEDLDLDCSLPLDANGLALSVVKVGSILETSEDVDLQLPGWRLRKSAAKPDVLTSENKLAHVQNHVDWLVYTSVAPQWEAFKTGFHTIIDEQSISFFDPHTLKLTVEGSSTLDVEELRNATQYDGYDANSKYIHTFWRIVGSWCTEKQKQLLKFVTAAERIPIGGPSQLTFIIKRVMLEDMSFLPTSSTCFGTLQLPRYPNAEVLDQRLSLAIEYGLEGFGTA